jgi:predicted 3-demethylubiquinone-9 3-methyltransferase (glyoxalase superfamily)
MLTITPFLWFATEAEEAMNVYTSIFKRSSVIAVHRAQGRTMSVVFELEGQRVMALNGRRDMAFNESFSFFVSCETQPEIDDLWAKLTADGGSPSQCGWLKDRFGLSWQIIPSTLGEMLGGGGDPARAGRVMQAMLGMSKLDVRQLQAAYDGP